MVVGAAPAPTAIKGVGHPGTKPCLNPTRVIPLFVIDPAVKLNTTSPVGVTGVATSGSP